MTISDLYLIFPIAVVAYLIWQHGSVGLVARGVVKKRCDQLGVQFLDQTVILRRMSVRFSKRSLLGLCREYEFEFATVGDRRYTGRVWLLGRGVMRIELEPFKEVGGKV